MGSPDIEEQIAKMDPEVSKIYFDAKNQLITEQDSSSEQFASAARIVQAFWKRFLTRRQYSENR